MLEFGCNIWCVEVCGALGLFADMFIATTSDPSSSDSEPAYTSTLPQYSTPNFSGREIELAKIETIFQNSVDLHKRVALFGLGGIG
jgi:hypothetical protein